jgi:hypothetical protein
MQELRSGKATQPYRFIGRSKQRFSQSLAAILFCKQFVLCCFALTYACFLLLPCFLVRSFPLALLPPLCPSRRVLALSLPYFKSLNTFIRTIQSSMLHQSSCSYSAFQMRTVLTLASLLVLLSCLGMLPSCSVQAGVVPGRMLNKGHEEVFAAQAKESERTKQRERKPVSPTSAGILGPRSPGRKIQPFYCNRSFCCFECSF